MKRILHLIFVCVITIALYNCSKSINLVNPDTTSESENRIEIINESPQRKGDPVKGRKYLLEGNYVSSGIPLELYQTLLASDNSNLLDRDGINATIPPEFTASTHPNGVDIVSPNCLTCHSEKINGEFILGLGNRSFDYTQNMTGSTSLLNLAVLSKYGSDSPEWKAYEQFSQATEKLNSEITTNVRGVNPADKLTSVLVAHRDAGTLEWSEDAMLKIPDVTIPSDVPPWWVLKKKKAMFYTAIGRGDFAKFLMASSLLTMTDYNEAEIIDSSFVDVLAWINTLQPPEFPVPVDQSLAKEGEKLFELNCSTCHGTYGPNGRYPNLLIPLAEIGTDSLLSTAYTQGIYSSFIDWYRESWFVQGGHPGDLVIESGYVAQPLDGIWASAPYLHNGSVPDLFSLLNSTVRPTYWIQSLDSNNNYDLQMVGLEYQVLDSKLDNNTYDTTLPGYGNQGHTFGDDLTTSERIALIEYLKTL